MLRVLPALIAFTVAGCGSGADRAATPTTSPARAATAAPATPTPTVTHAEFVAALNKSCDTDKAKQDRLSREFDSALERGELPAAGRVYQRMLPRLKAHVARITGLDVPARDRDAFAAYLKAQRRIVGLGDRITRALLKDDGAGVARLSEPFDTERDRRLTAALDLGAGKCGS